MFGTRPDFPTMLGDQLFPGAQLPPQTIINVMPSPEWWRNNPAQDPTEEAQRIISHYAGEIHQFIAWARALRQPQNLMHQVLVHSVPQLQITVKYSFGIEQVYLTAFPMNSSRKHGASVRSGGIFKIDIPFTGYPVQGMGTKSSTYPAGFQWYGPVYPFDFCQTPCDPGDKSTYDGDRKAFKAASPDDTPDMALGDWADPIFSQTRPINSPIRLAPSGDDYMEVGDPSGMPGYSASEYCPGVGGAAILATPLSGKQYWEVKITELPSQVPGGYTLNTTNIYGVGFDGMGVYMLLSLGNPYGSPPALSNSGNYTIPDCFSETDPGSELVSVTWLKEVDTWYTPSIGVVPSYYLPKDMRDAAPTDAPKAYLDYTRVPGLDPMLANLADDQRKARSITATSTVVGPIGRGQTGQEYVIGVWERQGFTLIGDTTSDYPKFYAALKSWADSKGVGPAPQEEDFQDKSPGGAAWLPFGSDNIYVFRSDGLPLAEYTDQTADWTSGMTSGGDGVIARIDSFLEGQVQFAFTPYYIWKERLDGPGDPGWDGIRTSRTGYNDYVWAGVGPITGPRGGDVWEGMTVSYFTQGADVRYTPGFKYSTYAQGVHLTGTGIPLFRAEVEDSTLGANIFAARDPPLPASLAGLYDLGKHMPVFIGRMDQLNSPDVEGIGSTGLGNSMSIASVGDGSETDLDKEDGLIAMFSGVDLGKLEEGDVIMMATDTDTGCVWFGKNGEWYAPEDGGGLCTKTGDPANGTGWAAVMDTYKKSASFDESKAPENYYPAVGYRVGPFKAEIVYDSGSLKYKPPEGFQVYGQSTMVYD